MLQFIEGYTRPEDGHARPGRHAVHPLTEPMRVVAPNVPGGHGIGCADPARQYEPVGQAKQPEASTSPAKGPVYVPLGHGCGGNVSQPVAPGKQKFMDPAPQ